MAVEYGLEEFEKVINLKLDLVVGRKFSSLRNQLEKDINKSARKLFRWMSDNVVNTTRNRFPIGYTPVYNWPPLNKRYAKVKGHNRFWYNRGVLAAWLWNTNPNRTLGKPRVTVKERKSKDGERVIHVQIVPYSHIDSFELPERIYNRLFGLTKRRMGIDVVSASNDEIRPIFEPSLEYFADTQLKRTFRQTVERVLGK